MAINRFNKITPLQFNLGEMPLQPLMGILGQKQKMFDENQAIADDLSNKYIEALPQDRARADQLVQGWRDQIDQTVAAANGDYSTVRGELSKLRRNITRQLSPGGEGAAIQGNFKNFNTALADERKRVGKKDGITSGQLNDWYKYTMGNYSGIGTKNPVTGTYSQLTPESIAQNVDAYKLGFDVAKELDPMKYSTKFDKVAGRWIVTSKKSGEILTAPEIAQAVGGRLKSNKPLMAMLEQEARFRGQTFDNTYLANSLDPIADSLANAFDVNNSSKEMSLKGNPYELARFKASLRKKLLDEMIPSNDIDVRTSPGQVTNTGFRRAALPDKFGSLTGKGKQQLAVTGSGTVPYGGNGATFSDLYGDFDGYYQKGLENVPEGLKDAYTTMFNNVKKQHTEGRARITKPKWMFTNGTDWEAHLREVRKGGQSKVHDREAAQMFQKQWNTFLDQSQTSSVTDVNIPANVHKTLKNTWAGQVRQATLMKRRKDGSYEQVAQDDNPFRSTKKKYRGINPTDYMPSHISTDSGSVGMKFVGPDGETYIATGVDDELKNQLGDVAAVQAPYITGEMGQFPLDLTLGGNTLKIPARSKVALNELGEAYLRVEVQVGPNEWVDAREATGDTRLTGETIMTEKRKQGAGNYFRNLDIHSNVIQFGDPKRYFDMTDIDN